MFHNFFGATLFIFGAAQRFKSMNVSFLNLHSNIYLASIKKLFFRRKYY